MSKSYKYNRSRKALTLEDCSLRLTDAIKKAEKIILSDKTTDNTALQAIHALSGAVSRMSKLIEVVELEKRIEALEEHQLKGKSK